MKILKKVHDDEFGISLRTTVPFEKLVEKWLQGYFPEDNELIDLCIQKFEEIKLAAEQRLVTDGRPFSDQITWPGTQSCVLCRKYLRQRRDCYGCPIYEYTGEQLCIGTPYEDLTELDIFTRHEFVSLVNAEIEFLKGLKT